MGLGLPSPVLCKHNDRTRKMKTNTKIEKAAKHSLFQIFVHGENFCAEGDNGIWYEYICVNGIEYESIIYFRKPDYYVAFNMFTNYELKEALGIHVYKMMEKDLFL
jgi:hypothetical protein